MGRRHAPPSRAPEHGTEELTVTPHLLASLGITWEQHAADLALLARVKREWGACVTDHVIEIATPEALPFVGGMAGTPMMVGWTAAGAVAWLCIDPRNQEPHAGLAEACLEVSEWLALGGRPKGAAELWGFMQPETLQAQIIVWLAGVERAHADVVMDAYATISRKGTAA